jgi:hypothetical protein
MGIVSSLSSGGGAVVKNAGTAAVLYVVTGLVAFLAVAFALLAAFFAMAPSVGPVWSALIVAGGLVLVAAILAVIAQTQVKRAKRRAAALASFAPMAAIAAPAAMQAAKRAPALLALALLAVGWVVARR